MLMSHLILFKPTGELVPVKEIKKKHDEFFHGELTEEFAEYCAHEAMHAFWINYQTHDKKIRKEVFGQKLKELVNNLLEEL